MMRAEMSAITDLSDHSLSTRYIITLGAEIRAITHHSDHFQSAHYIITTCNGGDRGQCHDDGPCPPITLSLRVMVRTPVNADPLHADTCMYTVHRLRPPVKRKRTNSQSECTTTKSAVTAEVR